MPKIGSELSRFIREALINKTYKNLEWVDESQQIFRLLCIHKNNKDWPKEFEDIFKDWHNIKDRKSNKNNWNAMYQRLLQALQKGPLIKKIKRITKDFYYHFVPDDGGSVDPGPPLHAECATVDDMEIENQVESNVIFSSARSPESGYASSTEVCNLNDFVDDNKTDYCGNRMDSILWMQQLDVDDKKIDYNGRSMDSYNLAKFVGDNKTDYSGSVMNNCNSADFVGDKNTDYSGSSNIEFHMEEMLKTPDKKLLEIISNALLDDKIFDGIATSTEETLTSVNSSAGSKIKKEIGNSLPVCLKVSQDVLDVALKNMTQEEDGEWILQFPPGTNIYNLQNGR